MNTVNITSTLAEAQRIRQDLKTKYDADVGKCYQCGKCSAGCPVAFAMDTPPHKVIQLAKLGLYDEMMECHSTWLCATCHTCSARCPREVHPSRIMEGLRIEARNQGSVKVRPLDIFHTKFMKLVGKRGRVYEMALMLGYNLSVGRPLKDAGFAPKMILNKKLSLFPHTTSKARKEVRKIHERYNRMSNTPHPDQTSGGDTP